MLVVYSYHDDIAKAGVIFGEVGGIMDMQELKRPEKDEKKPADNSIVLRDVHFGYHRGDVSPSLQPALQSSATPSAGTPRNAPEVLHGISMNLPQGYETVIGEGEASLSGGEKQRISIARAIMKDAPVIILDEATANIDPENERDLMEAVHALTREKTVIMIAHRLKTVRNADQIIVLDKGRISEEGKHGELINKGGIYARFIDSRKKAVSWKL